MSSPAAMNGEINQNDLHPEVKSKIEKLLQDRGITMESMELSPGTEKGDNYMGKMMKVAIQGTDKNGESITLNWITKTAPKMEALRKSLNMGKLYVREIYIYEKLFPYFERFQKEKLVRDTFNYYPIYLSSYDEPPNETIIMEDMRASGYVMDDRKKPLNYGSVRLVMKAYGKLHAMSYAIKNQRPDDFARIKSETKDLMMDPETQGVDTMQGPMFEKALDLLDPVKEAKAYNLYKKFLENMSSIFIKMSEEGLEDKYSVVCHGDSWINNMLFKYGNNHSTKVPTDICIVDWQVAKCGSPAYDLSYFIFTCTDKKLRDKHYNNMINVYYYSLCSHLAELGCDPHKVYPYDAFMNQLKRYSVVGVFISIMVLRVVLGESEEAPSLETAENFQDVANRMDYVSKNEDKYRERVHDLIIDAVERGYFDVCN